MAIDTLGANALASDSVTTVKIADNAVTGAKIPADAVVAADIADGSITSAKIADDAVNSAKINSTDAGMTLADLTVDTDTLKVDASNNRVGIGTTSPQKELHVKANNPGGKIRLEMGQTGVASGDVTGEIEFYQNDSSGAGVQANIEAKCINSAGKGELSLGCGSTSATEVIRMQNGSTWIGRSTYAAWQDGFGVESQGSGETSVGTYLVTGHNTNANDGRPYHYFFYNNGVIGGIYQNGTTGVAYNTSSDYRLKENVSYDFDATSRLKQLKPARFNFKVDKDTTVDGFLAHEVSSIVPEAIVGVKDETQDLGTIKDKDGDVIEENVLETKTKKDEGQTWTKTKTEDVYQGIDQSKLVPLLVKSMQEMEARIATLESK